MAVEEIERTAIMVVEVAAAMPKVREATLTT
jgi:hypothetical protein